LFNVNFFCASLISSCLKNLGFFIFCEVSIWGLNTNRKRGGKSYF
jgi:hypothetical protein